MSNPGPASTATPVFVGGGEPQVIGAASTSLVAFYGGTATTRPAAVTPVTTTAATTSSPWGYGASTQADAIVTAVNALISRLSTLGLTA